MNQSKAKKEYALILKSLLKTEFKEIKERVYLRFGEFGGTAKTWRDSKGRAIIEVNLNYWKPRPTRYSRIWVNKELIRHELLHILLNREDNDLIFIKEAKKRNIIGGEDFMLEFYQSEKRRQR